MTRQKTFSDEFNRQVDNLVERGYPALAKLSAAAFRNQLAPLEQRLPDLPADRPESRTSFVIVITDELVARDAAVPLLELNGKRGFTDMDGLELKRFGPPDGVAELPAATAYLVTDLDTGAETLNVTPDDALPTITSAGRSPLTIDEGLALITHHPEVLREQNCFSLLGSRCGDRRVPAIWVSKGRPRLDWCWAGNPHTWLGSASCGARVAAFCAAA